MRIGRVARSRPLSEVSGFDRGKPVDRYYIERFLAEHSADIGGRVLEIGESLYSQRYGGNRITRQDVLHIKPGNPEATIVGDLADPDALPKAAFDCVILTQTLQYVFDLATAIENIRASLRPGGVVLITAPGVAPICLDEWGDNFLWRFSAPSMRKLLEKAFEPAKVEVTPMGNLYSATAFLHGAAVQELSIRKLQADMPEYAIIIAARAVA